MTRSAPRNRLALTAIGVSLLIASAACVAGGGRSSGSDPFQGPTAGSRSSRGGSEIRIQVRNSNFNEGAITAVRPGNRRRLGRVQGASDREFRMPWTNSDRLYFEIDLLAGPRCVTRAIFVDPGQTLLLVIDSTRRPRSDGISRMCDVQRSR